MLSYIFYLVLYGDVAGFNFCAVFWLKMCLKVRLLISPKQTAVKRFERKEAILDLMEVIKQENWRRDIKPKEVLVLEVVIVIVGQFGEVVKEIIGQ